VFDNVDIDDIAKVALEWEQRWGFIRGGDIAARERRWEMGNSLTLLSSEKIRDLAKDLCEKARENSLDSTIDSPFALLAKDNDIMWSGGTSRVSLPIQLLFSFHSHLLCQHLFTKGMPDDCTVIVAHVVGRAADDMMDHGGQ
jgi:hypothetical protein